MKFLNFVVISILATALFTSCLGDSDNKYEGTSFGYAQYDSEGGNGLYVRTLSYYARLITSSEIKAKLTPSDCALINFKVVNPSSGLNQVESAEITKLPGKSELSTMIPAIAPGNEIFPDNFDFDMVYGGYSADEYFGDRWLYTIQVKREDDTKLVAYFFYDKNNQKITTQEGEDQGTVTEVEGNQMIIDVRFAKSSGEEAAFTAKGSGSTYFVGDLSQIRQIRSGVNYPKPTDENIDYIIVPVVFRYKRATKDDKNNDVIKETILGRWSSTGSSDYYYRPFVFEKKK